MKIEYFKTYSRFLDREMEFKVYGGCGRPMLVFPCQNGRFFDYEDQKMIDTIAPFINSGRLQVFCVDSIDQESWSSTTLDGRTRMENHERYFNYIESWFLIFSISMNKLTTVTAMKASSPTVARWVLATPLISSCAVLISSAARSL